MPSFKHAPNLHRATLSDYPLTSTRKVVFFRAPDYHLHSFSIFNVFHFGHYYIHRNTPYTVGCLKFYPFKNFYLQYFQDEAANDAIKRNFNFRLSSNRMVVERAFGLLKGRFRCLHRTILFRKVETQVTLGKNSDFFPEKLF